MIPKKGVWIMIKGVLPIEMPIPPLSVWYAKPTGNLIVDDGHMASEMAFVEQLAFEYCGLNKDQVIRHMFDLQKNPDSWRGKTPSIDNAVRKLSESFTITQQVQIMTQWGAVNVQPHEYTVVKDTTQYLEAIDDGHAFMVFVSKTKQLTGKLKEQVFYIRSSGIGYVDALKMCLPLMNTQHLFYIVMHKEYQKMFTRNYEGLLHKRSQWASKQRKIKAA